MVRSGHCVPAATGLGLFILGQRSSTCERYCRKDLPNVWAFSYQGLRALREPLPVQKSTHLYQLGQEFITELYRNFGVAKTIRGKVGLYMALDFIRHLNQELVMI